MTDKAIEMLARGSADVIRRQVANLIKAGCAHLYLDDRPIQLDDGSLQLDRYIVAFDDGSVLLDDGKQYSLPVDPVYVKDLEPATPEQVQAYRI